MTEKNADAEFIVRTYSNLFALLLIFIMTCLRSFKSLFPVLETDSGVHKNVGICVAIR